MYPLAENRVFMPGPATIDDLDAMHAALGIERVVIVQASPQGFDNSRLLHALQERRARGQPARGVAVVRPQVAAVELTALFKNGVRGLRLNLQSHGRTDSAAAGRELLAVAGLAAGCHMHVQVYTTLAMIAELHDVMQQMPVPVVVDHFGLADVAAGPTQPGLQALISLLRSGQAYVKLSAPYRIIRSEDGSDGRELVRALIDANPCRMLWGTDWPHTGAWPGTPRRRLEIEPFHPIDDGLQLNLFGSWTTARERTQILVENPAELYQF